MDIGGPLNEAGTVRGRFVATGDLKDLQQNSTWHRDQAYYGTLEADLASGTLLCAGANYGQCDSNR